MASRPDSPPKEDKAKRGFRYTYRGSEFIYEESLSPNHVHLWLALCLPSDALDKNCGSLRLHIPDTLIYGFGKNPIWLLTDEKGYVNKKLGDECSEENIFSSFSGPGVVALDKEPGLVSCINPAAEFEGPPTVKYEGTYVSPLSAPSLRRLLLKPRQQPPRVFAIQRVVSSKYGDHSTTVRISYSRDGRSSAWSMTRRQPFIEKTASPQKQRREGTVSSVPYGAGPLGEAAAPETPSADGGGGPRGGPSPARRLRRLDTVLSEPPEGALSPAGVRRQNSDFSAIDSADGSSPPHSPSKRQSISDQNIEDITNLYDDNVAVSHEEPKRFLDFLSDKNCVIDEVMPLAAEPIVEIAAAMTKHFSNIFRRRMEELTVDVAKDARGFYSVVDIVAFRFEDGEISPVKLSARVSNRIEIECNCILDPFRSHLDPAQVHAANMTLTHSKDNACKLSKIDWNAQAVGAAPCSMCESRLPPDQLCYAITSTLIQSTIVHMRSRLPQKYWPNFCRDSCYAVRSMLRIEGDPFNIKGLTVADIRICALCYEICNKEMALVEIEQKLSKFTRTTKEKSSARPAVLTKATTLASFSSCIDPAVAEGETDTQKSQLKPKQISSDWNPTENFRMRNRPSVLVKFAQAQETSKKLNKNASEPALRQKRTALGKDDLMMRTVPAAAASQPARPKSAGGNSRKADHAVGPSSPVGTSPIRRRGTPQQSPAPSGPKEPGNTPAKSVSSFSKIAAASKQTAAADERLIPAQGRPVVRSSLNENMTMCRALVGIQQIKDLPVIIFEHFENFRVQYTMLGREIEFPAVKKAKYYRKDAYRYKTFTLEGENDSVSLSSSGSGEDEGSDFEAGRRGSGMLSKVSEEGDGSDPDSSSGDESSQENVSIVVGTLAVQRMRVGYALIPGNSAEGGSSPELERYFAKNRKILIVLCGDVKEGVNIYDENRWLCPPAGFSSVEKSQNLQQSLTNIRLDAVNKSLFQGQYSSSNNLRQKHLSRLFRKSYKDLGYTPQRTRKTEAGETLPKGAIAYGYVDFYQFLNATVNRVDVVAPMTYALSHVPRERSVPMLKAVVGFERIFSPIDTLSIPYSMVNVGHSKGYEAFVAELEDQLSSSEPLPAEWLVSGTQDDSSSTRRKAVATFLQMKSIQESSSAMMSGSRLDIESDVFQNTQANDFANNVMDGKRTAPIKFHHESRNEQKTLDLRKEQKIKHFKDEEELKERNPNSLWCFSAHVVSGHHMGGCIPEYLKENSEKLQWSYRFKFLGDTITASCTTQNECGFDEVFRFDSLSKHYFLGEIAALEDMFMNMESIDFELKLVDEAAHASTESSRTSKIVVRQKARGTRESVVLAIPVETAFAQRFTGSFSLNEFKTQRFFESTILLSQHVDLGVEECVYPPYVFAEFHFFRMGGGNGLSMSIPNHLALGKEVVPGVRRVVKKNKLVRAPSFTPATT